MATHRANASRDRATPVKTTDDGAPTATANSRKSAAKGSSVARSGAGAAAEPKSVASTTKTRAKPAKTAPKAKWVNALQTPAAEAKGRKRAVPKPDADLLDQWVNTPAGHTDSTEPGLPPASPAPASKPPPVFAQATKRARAAKRTNPAAERAVEFGGGNGRAKRGGADPGRRGAQSGAKNRRPGD